ncbi:MAG: AsmA family protein [Gammaproteobacteria bacterium]
MRKFLYALAITIGVLVALLVLVLFFFDFGRFRPQLEAAASEALGRPLEINGPFEVRVLPNPRVVVEGLTLANAPWSSQATMASVDHFSARIDLFSLLSGPVVVEELRVKGVDLLVEEGPEGQNNWTFGEGQPEEPEPSEDDGKPGEPAVVLFADVQDVEIIMRRPGEEDRVITVSSLRAQEEQDAIGLSGAGNVLGLPLDLGGQIAPLSRLKEGAGAGYEVTGNLGQLAFALEGGSAAPEAGEAPSRLEASLKTPAIEELLSAARVESSLAGAWSMDASLTARPDQAELALESLLNDVSATANVVFTRSAVDFDAQVAPLDKAGGLLEVEGLPPEALSVRGRAMPGDESVRLENVVIQVGEDAAALLDGTLSGSVGETTDLAFDFSGTSISALRADLPALPFSASGRVVYAPSSLKLEPLEARVGDSDLSGSLDVAFGQPVSVRGELQSRLLDLSPFMPDDTTEEQPSAEAPEEAPEEAPAEKIFTDEPLPLDGLARANADLKLGIDEIRLAHSSIEDFEAQLTLDDGRLEVVQRLSGLQGGGAASHTILTASGTTADLKTRVRMEKLAARLLSGPDVPAEEVPRVDITVDLAARGATTHELASSLTGRLLFTQAPGKIKNSLVGKFSGDIIAQLFSALNPFAETDEFSKLECTIMSTRFVGGLGETDGFLMQTEKLQIVGSGTVDLNEEQLEFEFNTKPRSGVGVSADMFVTPFVKLSGPLAQPGVALNAKGALLSGGAAIATGGLSFLVQGLFDRASAEGDRCARTLEEVSAHISMEEVLGSE